MKISYRPEIDGLRAIAVISVILYHAEITLFGHQPFKGGFIGVDIFFVISGYLITSIILKELITTGVFSFKHFYERRIRRILPALLFVMLVSMPLAWVYLLPDSFINFSKSILYSLGFNSNFYFWYSDQQYGTENSLLIPFLHTWSLSVEEQYYVLFPIILLIIFKFFKKNLVFILFIFLLVSLLIADMSSKIYTSSTFYFIHTRVWELMAGSILAYFEISLGSRKLLNNKLKVINLILPSVGLFLILSTVVFFKGYFRHPSFYTLIPVIGVCLIIWFSQKNEIVTKMLSTKLFVSIGLISYSLYLWHYPIFSFDRIIEFTGTNNFKKLLMGLLILLLSIFSFYFIEKPARNKKNKFKTILFSVLFISSILIVFNSSVILKEGYYKRVPTVLQKNVTSTWDTLTNSKNEKCFNNKERCVFNSNSNKKFFMIGDSHMAALALDLKNRTIKKNYSFISSTFSACLYFPGFNLIEKKTNRINKNCNNDYFSELNKIFEDKDNSILLFGGRFPLYFSNKYFDNQEGGIEGKNSKENLEWGSDYFPINSTDNLASSLKNSIEKLSKKNKIILIYPIPEAGYHVPEKIFNIWINRDDKLSKDLKFDSFVTTSYEVYKERVKSSFETLDSIQGNNIYRVYPHSVFCNTLIKNRCVTHDDKNIFYYDYDHLSDEGARMVNNLIMNEVRKIELEKK